MKKTCLLFVVTFLFLSVSTLYLPTSFAQDYTQWHLPEGAKLRLGKGSVQDIAYSPDGSRLAVASSIGIWIYDAQTGEALDLLTGHTGSVNSVVFSPDGSTLASADDDYKPPSVGCQHRNPPANSHKVCVVGHHHQRSIQSQWQYPRFRD